MKRVVEELCSTLGDLLESDGRVHVFGESIEDPYGGAFKVTKGLSTRFPGRVFDTPISESGLTGLACGMALRGQRPVLEIMFGDFMTLCLDQLLNSATKFTVMFGDPVAVPMVIRTPMGGRRGYGPTHSQTLEKHFLGVPNLDVVSPSHLHDVGACLRHAVQGSARPTLFVEHKLLYAERLVDDAAALERGLRVTRTPGPYETVSVVPVDADEPEVSVFAYGGTAPLVLDVAQRLARDEEIFVEVVLPALLSPLDVAPLAASLARTGKGVIFEEGTRANGWGADLCARLHEADGVAPGAQLVRLAARDQALPSCKDLELQMLPGAEDLERAIVSLV